MGRFVPFQPAAAEYPSHLALPQPERLQLSSARWLLVLLVLLSLVPRAAVALRIAGIAGDGVNYVNAARALAAGNYRASLWEGGLNVYPAILAILHGVGLDWETAAAAWGVLISSLVVLPLWGWVRRQFDDRVALFACLLYITHPRFIAESPELMRDPTFWFFFMLAVYCLWRAVTEVRHTYFLASGAAITLAALTRVEGLFLVVPLVLWTFWRWRALQTDRRKLLVGAALCVLAFPLLLALVNLIWMRGHSHWAMIRVSPFERIRPWLESLFGMGGVRPPESPPNVGLILWRFFPTMTRGFSPVFALLMFGGMWGWRRTWRRRDHITLFYTAVVILLGVWVQAWTNWYLKGNINARYALPIALLGSPFAALGLLGLVARLLRIADRRGWRAGSRRGIVSAVAACVLVPAVLDVLHNNLKTYGERQMETAVGRWLAAEFPAPPMIVAPWDIVSPISYYAGNGPYVKYRYDESDEAIFKLVAGSGAEVVLMRPGGPFVRARCDRLADRIQRLGFHSVAADVLPSVTGDCRVFVRVDRLKSAQHPTVER